MFKMKKNRNVWSSGTTTKYNYIEHSLTSSTIDNNIKAIFSTNVTTLCAHGKNIDEEGKGLIYSSKLLKNNHMVTTPFNANGIRITSTSTN
jgi:hypothetical protein